MVLLIKDPPSRPMKDIFAQVGHFAPAEDEENHTLKLFGRHPTIHDLTEMGFQNTPAKLSCRVQKADQEIPIAISLILKATAQWAEKVFKIKDLPGFIFFGNQGERCTVEARPHDSTADYFVTYTTPNRKRCEARLRRFRIVKGGKDHGPPWLEALGKAIRGPEEAANWASLHKALSSAHAPAESLRSIMKIIQQVTKP